MGLLFGDLFFYLVIVCLLCDLDFSYLWLIATFGVADLVVSGLVVYVV